MIKKESDMDRRYIAPSIPLDTYRQALSAFRLNRATILRLESKRGGPR
jgi:hypothetical protein